MSNKKNITGKAKKLLKASANFVITYIKKMKPFHYVALVLILALGIFNGITGLAPVIKQHNREQNIVRTFNRWWKDVGAQEFQNAGLAPTKQLKYEEFVRYREKYNQQNPSFIIEERIESMKKDYREWWENQGGRESFVKENNRYPDEQDFRVSLDSWINKFTNKFVRYSYAFVPKQGNYESAFTSWMLFPNVYSFLSFAAFFFFACVMLNERWKVWITLGFTALLAVSSPILVDILAGTSFFNHYADDRYMGMSLAVVFLLGASAFGPQKKSVPQKITAIAVAGLLIEMIINWFANPGIFGAVTILSPACFGLGALAGMKIEPRRKSRDEINAEALQERLRQNAARNPMAERKAKTRALIEAGFTSAKNCRPDQAQLQLGQALTQLLQEHPVDTSLVKSTAERMTAPDQYLEFSSNQWLEWGEIAKAKNAPEAAIALLKKSLSKEKDKNFARRALFILGDICINNKIEMQDGINRLQKVIEMNGNDMLAMQARRMLEAQGISAKPTLQQGQSQQETSAKQS